MNCIVSKIFIDTNILVYTLDTNDQTKQNWSRNMLHKLINEHQAVLSTQVLSEFFVVATKKLEADPIIIKNIIHNFHNMEIVNTDSGLVDEAIDISVIYKLSYWDSLIIAAAERAQCQFIISEDLNPGQNYRGIRLINPFTQDF